MYLRKKDARQILMKHLLSSRTELENHSAFLVGLLQEDDWSFVIKSHAVIEAAVTQMIADYLGETRLKAFIERLPLSDTQNGKLIITKQLGLLEEKERKFIRWLSELRNVLVHKIENVNFDMKEHFDKLDKNQRRVWVETITCGMKDEKGITNFRQLIEIAPKVAVHMTLFLIVASCVLASTQSKHKKELNEVAERSTKALLEELLEDGP